MATALPTNETREAPKAGPDEWVDAQQMHRDHPKTFAAPEATELGALTIGCCVKVSNGRERFWVRVVAIDGTGGDPFRYLITARVSDRLIEPARYGVGDLVQLEGRHVYSL